MASGFTDQLRTNRERLKSELLAMARAVDFTDQAREEFIANAKHHHLTHAEIQELIRQIESADDMIEAPRGEYEALSLAASNPEFALAQYRMLVSRLRELAAVADNAYISQQLQRPGHSTDMDRAIWEQIDRGRPSSE